MIKGVLLLKSQYVLHAGQMRLLVSYLWKSEISSLVFSFPVISFSASNVLELALVYLFCYIAYKINPLVVLLIFVRENSSLKFNRLPITTYCTRVWFIKK